VTRGRLRLAAYGSVYLTWGSTYPAIRYLVSRGVPPFLLIGARVFCAGAMLMLLARLRGAARPVRREWLGGAALGFVFLVLCNGAATWGLQFIGAGKATLMTACVPLLALAYGWAFRGRRVSLREALCLGLGLAGVAVLVGPEGRGGPHGLWGLGAIAWAVLVWALGMAEADRVPQAQDGVMASGVQMLCGGVVLLALSACLEHPLSMDYAAIPWQSWAAWAYLVVFGSCVGYLSFTWLIKHEPPQLAGTYALVNPVVAVLLGWAFLGESVAWNTLLATLLIIGGVAGSLWFGPHSPSGRA
jgi:drug/metabolite transporter (DMT)-like permease